MAVPSLAPKKVRQDVFVSLTANTQGIADDRQRTCTNNTAAPRAVLITDAESGADSTLQVREAGTYPDLANPESPSGSQPVQMDLHTPAPTPPIGPENGDRQLIPQIVVDHFAFGNAGAPAPGAHQEPLPDHHWQEQGTNPWAPFRSQCDWEFARWGKMRGATASSLTDVLAIPQVHASN